jgi:EmrB/QacA subfamily drug resistance transporter
VAADGAPYRWRWLALTTLLAAGLMDVLDALVTTAAGPRISAQLGGGTTLIQWLTAGYTLAMAAELIIGGRLGDRYGRKRMFLIGVACFTASSMLCALAWDPGSLIAFRVAQGLSGAVMLPQSMGLVIESFPRRQLPTAFSFFGPVLGAGTVGGPCLGGWLADANLLGAGWRMIFLVNLPLGLLCLVLGARCLPRGAAPTVRRLDLPGALIVSAAAVLLVYPVVQGRDLGWPAWTFVSCAAGVALFAAFGRHEARVQRRGGDPLIVVGLLRKRAYTGGLFAAAALYCALVGQSLVFTAYTQLGLGFSPAKASLAMLPQAAGTGCGLLASRFGLTARLGRAQILIGLCVAAAGIIGLWFTLGHVRPRAHGGPAAWQFGPALLVVGVGLGLALTALINIVLAAVEPHETGSASGIFAAVQQFGGALGAAVLGTVFFGVAAHDGMAASARRTLWLVVALLAAALSAALVLPRRSRTLTGR